MKDLTLKHSPYQLLRIDFTADIQHKHFSELRKNLGYVTNSTLQEKNSKYPIVTHQYATGAWGSTWLLIFRLAEGAWRALLVSDKQEPPSSHILGVWVKEIHDALKIFNGDITSKVVVSFS